MGRASRRGRRSGDRERPVSLRGVYGPTPVSARVEGRAPVLELLRSAEQEALPVADSQTLHGFELLVGLDALGDDLDLELLGEAHDRSRMPGSDVAGGHG